MFDDGVRYGVDALENFPGNFRIGNLESIRLVERDHQLQGIHRIQTHAARTKQRLVVADFLRADLEHEVLDHQPADVLFDCGCIIHCKIKGG